MICCRRPTATQYFDWKLYFFCRIWRCCQQFRVLESSHQICGRSIWSILRRGIKSRADTNEGFKGTRMLIFHRTNGPLFETLRHWIYETNSRKGTILQPWFLMALCKCTSKGSKEGSIVNTFYIMAIIFPIDLPMCAKRAAGIMKDIEKAVWKLNLWTNVC